jgi:hypothetical protein
MSAANVDQALGQKLSGDAGVQAIVGSNPTAVYMGLLPQNAIENKHMPAISFWSITENDPAISHDGASGVFRTRYQFTCWGLTMTDSSNVARAIKKCLHGFRGLVGGYDLGPCLLISSVSQFDQAENLFMTHVDMYVSNQG